LAPEQTTGLSGLRSQLARGVVDTAFGAALPDI
jgi:hypothetical protein